MIQCAICGQDFNQISFKHLLQHNMTLPEYKAAFPMAPTRSPEAIAAKKLSAAKTNSVRIGVKRSKETIDKIKKSKQDNPKQAWNKGIAKTDQEKQHLSSIRKQRFKTGDIVHWNSGRTTSDDTKTKIRTTALSQHRTYAPESKLKRADTISTKKGDGWIHSSSMTISETARLKLSDPIWLQNEQTTKSCFEIADMLEVDPTTVHRAMAKFRIEITRHAVSGAEREIALFLDSINVEYKQNTRSVIAPFELDIYIPEHNLAIEYCGLYWHSDVFKSKNYHLDKLEACTKKGIRLLTIFEDEWVYKQNIVLSKIQHILKRGIESKIFARKCKIVTVESSAKEHFFNMHHIQGDGPGSISYGLQIDDKLLAVMSFIRKQNGTYVLNRYATACHVLGGFTKLLSNFIKIHKPIEIVSFADRRWSTGAVYEQSNFVLDKILPPDYSYVNQQKRFHKFNFRHSQMVKKLSKYDPNLSETQNMLNHNMHKIYNCGLLRYVWKQQASQ